MALEFKCIDTMKISRDSASYTNDQIIAFVAQYANLGLTHLTVDAYLDGTFQSDQYILNWVTAIRNAGMKVWWRGAYADPYGVANPAALTTLIGNFPTAHPTYFADGDIYDMLAENNPGGGGDLFHPGGNPAQLIAGWNQWLQDTKTSLDFVFSGIGKSGVITGITSITDYLAKNNVTPTTYGVLGYACMDDYPTDGIKDPIKATQAVTNSLIALHNYAGVPVVVGEYGYYRLGNSDKSLQREVLRTVWNNLASFDWLIGYNYWCGHGGAGFGDYCNLLESVSGGWVARPALKTLGEYFTKGACTGRMDVI